MAFRESKVTRNYFKVGQSNSPWPCRTKAFLRERSYVSADVRYAVRTVLYIMSRECRRRIGDRSQRTRNSNPALLLHICWFIKWHKVCTTILIVRSLLCFLFRRGSSMFLLDSTALVFIVWKDRRCNLHYWVFPVTEYGNTICLADILHICARHINKVWICMCTCGSTNYQVMSFICWKSVDLEGAES